jgi:hypothetical protein
MGKIRDKIIDVGGYTDFGRSNLRNQDREVGPSQRRTKGIRTAIPVSTMMANELDEIETAAQNKDKTRQKNMAPDLSNKDKVIPMTAEDKEVLNSPEFKRASESTMDKKKGGMIKTKKYSKGGTASSRADGIATKGKTRGKIC